MTSIYLHPSPFKKLPTVIGIYLEMTETPPPDCKMIISNAMTTNSQVRFENSKFRQSEKGNKRIMAISVYSCESLTLTDVVG